MFQHYPWEHAFHLIRNRIQISEAADQGYHHIIHLSQVFPLAILDSESFLREQIDGQCSIQFLYKQIENIKVRISKLNIERKSQFIHPVQMCQISIKLSMTKSYDNYSVHTSNDDNLPLTGIFS